MIAYSIIRGNTVEPGLVYHERRGDWVEFIDVDGNRYDDYPGDVVVRWEIRTRCGLLVDWWTRDDDANLRYMVVHPGMENLIGRPCLKCYDVVDT